ncbi:hypothetical protein MRS44_003935 [Fusarium solani]|uniref:uncharacterized protein n=1 Tax=Fusarium solani TaxID=169388 RepID=UPI0032C45325|nr:hypothetical protein MRS44_003935 [Fusarium solani]
MSSLERLPAEILTMIFGQCERRHLAFFAGCGESLANVAKPFLYRRHALFCVSSRPRDKLGRKPAELVEEAMKAGASFVETRSMVVYRDSEVKTIHVSPAVFAAYQGRIDIIDLFLTHDKTLASYVGQQLTAAIFARRRDTAKSLGDRLDAMTGEFSPVHNDALRAAVSVGWEDWVDRLFAIRSQNGDVSPWNDPLNIGHLDESLFTTALQSPFDTTAKICRYLHDKAVPVMTRDRCVAVNATIDQGIDYTSLLNPTAEFRLIEIPRSSRADQAKLRTRMQILRDEILPNGSLFLEECIEDVIWKWPELADEIFSSLPDDRRRSLQEACLPGVCSDMQRLTVQFVNAPLGWRQHLAANPTTFRVFRFLSSQHSKDWKYGRFPIPFIDLMEDLIKGNYPLDIEGLCQLMHGVPREFGQWTITELEPLLPKDDDDDDGWMDYN